jgi:hypothetical protein
VAPDGIKRVLKEMVALSNGDKYYGFWYISIIKHYEGIQLLMKGMEKEQ